MRLIQYHKVFYCSIATVLISSFFSCIIYGGEKLPTLWDFGAKQCISCKKMTPILNQMSKDYKDHFIVKFTDVWIEENVKEAKKNRISSIPTQIFFDKNGKELFRHVGYISKENILAKWNSLGYNFIITDKAKH